MGTFVPIYAGTAVATAALLALPVAGASYDSLSTPLAFGLALLVVVAAIGHVSGGHVNPAVTLGLAATGRFPWRYVPAYLIAQLIGAVLGALATWATLGSPGRDTAHLAATALAPGVGVGQGLLVEVLVTFVLVLTMVSVATDDRVAAGVAPIAVGVALAVAVLIAGPVTGGAVNPARALGPMLVSGNLADVWIYLLGQIVGGALAAGLRPVPGQGHRPRVTPVEEPHLTAALDSCAGRIGTAAGIRVVPASDDRPPYWRGHLSC